MRNAKALVLECNIAWHPERYYGPPQERLKLVPALHRGGSGNVPIDYNRPIKAGCNFCGADPWKVKHELAAGCRFCS